MKVAIIQPLYLPWAGFFEMIAASDAYVAFDHVKFESSSWQHRNRVKGPNGPFYLTVPVINEKEERGRICDCRIDYRQPWVKKHLKSLESCYRKAPYFDRFYQELTSLLEAGTEKIADLNVGLIRLLLKFLGLGRKVIRSSEFPLGDDTSLGKNERLIHLMKTVGATRFYEGASGRNFIDRKRFEEEGMAVEFQEYRHPSYPQQFDGFLPYMSVVDLLFNCGDGSLSILRSGGEGADCASLLRRP
jgi:hypothetical protein